MKTEKVLHLFLVRAQVDMEELSKILNASPFLTFTAYTGGELVEFLQDKALVTIYYLDKIMALCLERHGDAALNKVFRLNFKSLGKISIVTYLKMNCKDEFAAQLIYEMLRDGSL